MTRQLTVNHLATIAFKKGKPVQTLFVEQYYSQYWEDYFSTHLSKVAAYLVECNDYEQIERFIHVLTLSQQSDLTQFIHQQAEANQHKEKIINKCTDWESMFYYFLFLSKDIVLDLIEKLYSLGNEISWDLRVNRFLEAIKHLALMTFVVVTSPALALASFITGLPIALLGLCFTLAKKLIEHDLQQRNIEYGDAYKINNLASHLNLFFKPATSPVLPTEQTANEISAEMPFFA